MAEYHEWKELRVKTDETVDDTDWAGTNAAPDSSIRGQFPRHDGHSGKPYTGIECIVYGRAAGVLVNRSNMTVDMALVATYDVAGVTYVADTSSAATTAVPLNRLTYFDFNGGDFTIRLTNDANEAVDEFVIHWRAVTR